MAIWMMAIQAGMVPVAAPPAPPLPPPLRPITSIQGASAANERFSVEFEIRSGRTLLQSGTLRIATGGTASFRRDQNEASAERCLDERFGSGMAQQSLSLQLNAGRFSSVNRLGVTLRWGRPVEGACPISQSARIVELNDSIELAPGKSVTLTGDGGLVLTLTRR